MKRPNGITTILFDLDDTLRHNDPKGHNFFWDFAESLGAPASEEDRRRAQKWAFQYWADSEHLLDDLKIHGRGEEAFWHNYTMRHLMELGCTPEQAEELTPQIREHFDENYDPDDIVLPEARKALDDLHEAGYTLAVVTNRNEPVQEYVEELGLGSYFDFTLAGGEINSWKPKPGIFQAALQRAGASPDEAVYVGDNYYADIIGARNAGIHPILLDPHNHFPEADCPVIHSLAELQSVLANGLKS
ncbi:MAG: HAD family hydrolase [Anaerolineae bacterium]|nr:HAD family hydrolase [Anaerolineae bacterium]